MRRLFIAIFILGFTFTVSAQTDSIPKMKVSSIPTKDHFMLQLGVTTWPNKPDSVRTSGLSRTFNMYVMMDFPFKTNPKLSVALGPGIATDNIFLDKTNVGIRENTTTIRFQNVKDTSHFKKYKLATSYLELPLELRFSSRPGDNAKSIKAALGVKVAMLLASWVKGKELQNKSDNLIADYTMKEKSKKFFNTNRISAIGRLGYGHFSLFASYSLTPLFKEGNGPKVQPLTIGLAVSGL